MPRAAEVQEVSIGLVNKWGKQRGALAVKEAQRGSERFRRAQLDVFTAALYVRQSKSLESNGIQSSV